MPTSAEMARYFRLGTAGMDVLTISAVQTSGVGLRGNDTLNGHDRPNFLVGDFFDLAWFDSFDSAGHQIAPLPDYDLTQTGNDILYGGAGNDTLISDQGDDTLFGGTGDDDFLVWSQNLGGDVFRGGGHGARGDRVIFEDTWQQGFTYFIASRLIFDQIAAISRVSLNGFGLHGTAGDDVFSFINTFLQYASAGQAQQSIDMGAGNDRFTGSAASDSVLLGDGDDWADGRYGNNLIDGGAGNDRLLSSDGNDTLIGGLGSDTLTGGSGYAHLFGGGGNDLLSKGRTAEGGAGNDTITSFHGNGGDGDDLLTGQVLGGDFGNDTLMGTGVADSLSGGKGDDSLWGDSSNDTLDGAAGNDRLDAGADDDVLTGGAGLDTLIGGTGDDTYHIDSLDDLVVEVLTNRGGRDRVVALDMDYSLGAFLEDLTLSGLLDVQGVGNALANQMTGNDGDNLLTGLAGEDFLQGENGNDRLFGGDGKDSLMGGEGDDTLDGGAGADLYYDSGGNNIIWFEEGDRIAYWTAFSGIDTIVTELTEFSHSLYWEIDNVVHTTASDFRALGNGLNNRMEGNSGNDFLSGYGGNDTLVGGAGADVFMFSHEMGVVNADVITDFTSGEDRIRFLASTFVTIVSDLPLGRLSDAAFRIMGSGGGLDAEDRILYDPTSGKVYYDPDGNGAVQRILFARLEAGAALAATDFFVA